MKKLNSLLIALAVCSIANAQFSFSDDFESYTVGDYIGSNSAVWTTWSGATGGAEDAQVTDANANASSNSIYFESTATNGGPQDVVLDFGDVFSTGDFVFQSDFYVNQSAGAYFNFQAESVIGTTWALDCHMVDGGISFQNGSTVMLSAAYTQATWFTMKMEINLTTNNWEVFIDGVSMGSFANGETQIASIDIFPTQGNQFYVDNISALHTPYVMPQLNGAMLMINPIEGLVSQERYASVEVKNLGLTTISSFDVVLNYGSTELTESVSGVSLNSFDGMTVDFNSPIILGEGSSALTATINNINGLNIDDDTSDDSKTIEVTAVKPADGKMVIAEEGTGTWCGWCPRGTVAMDLMARDFEGFYQGIAIHNGDPMELAVYDQDLDVSGYPSALVDRGTEIDPGDIKVDFMERILVEPSAFISNGASVDEDSLNVSLTVDFNLAASGNWKIACVLTEDNVSGVSSGYSQSNYYSGGDAGDLVGVDGTNWADLPGTVSASNMVYHHVARALSPSFEGYSGFPNSIESGSTYTFNFKFAIDENWKTEDMHIVGMLIGADSKIDNGSSSSIDDAIAAGFVSGTNVLGTTKLSQFDDVLSIYPNPSTGFVKLSLNIKDAATLELKIINVMGQTVASRNYGNLVGSQILPLNVSEFPSGIYTVEVLVNGSLSTKQFVKQ
ncbi:MAG: Omp28-related outer membrane protein [Flavobacteriales bacterium]